MDDNLGTIDVEDEMLRRGYTSIPNLILGRDDISPGAKLVYIGLLHFAWQKDSCFPGQTRLGMFLGFGERTVRRHMRELEDAGLVVTTRRGLTKTNHYRLPKRW